jgi:hypothetical protein
MLYGKYGIIIFCASIYEHSRRCKVIHVLAKVLNQDRRTVAGSVPDKGEKIKCFSFSYFSFFLIILFPSLDPLV